MMTYLHSDSIHQVQFSGHRMEFQSVLQQTTNGILELYRMVTVEQLFPGQTTGTVLTTMIFMCSELM